MRCSPAAVAALCALLLACAPLAPVRGATILMAATPVAASHQQCIVNIARELASRGHRVLLLQADHDQAFFKKHASTLGGLELITHATNQSWEDRLSLFHHAIELDDLEAALLLARQGVSLCRQLLADSALMQRLRSESIDIIAYDIYFSCMDIIEQIVQPRLPAVRIHPTAALAVGHYEWLHPFGSSLPGNFLSVSPHLDFVYGAEGMSFAQRFGNMLAYTAISTLLRFAYEHPYRELMLEQGLDPDQRPESLLQLIPDTPGIGEIELSAPQFKFVGALTPKEPQPLSEAFEAQTQSADGVVLVTFGTWTLLPSKQQGVVARGLRDGLARLPTRMQVIWKTNTSDPRQVDPIRQAAPSWDVVGWMPQNDLLAHPKVRLIITHGGYNSIAEIAHYGVPAVVIPLVADQGANAARLVRRGAGLALDKTKLSEASVADAVVRVLSEPAFAGNATRLSRIARQANGTRGAADWVEYALATDGARHLAFPAWRRMNWFQRTSVDVFAFAAALAVLVVSLLLAPLVACLRCTAAGRRLVSFRCAFTAVATLVPAILVGLVVTIFN